MQQLFDSKSNSNLVQIIVFFGLNLTCFKIVLNNLRKYAFKSVPPEKHLGIVLRIISIIHASIATLSSMVILYYDNDLNQNKLLYSSFPISLTLNFSMGYLVFDFLIIIIDKNEFDPAFLLHHFVSVLSFYSCSTIGVFPYIALFRLTSEASTPFLNIRWILLTLDKKSSRLYLLNGIMLVIVFFIVRITTIIPNWLIFFSLINTPEWYAIELKYKLICVVSCIPLDVMNLYWFSKIIQILVKYFKVDLKKLNNNLTATNSEHHKTNENFLSLKKSQ